jgi:hypothetical protein
VTLKIPRAVLYVLAAGIVLGVGIAAFSILREPAKDCLTDSGAAVSCDTADSLSQSAYDQMKQDELAVAKAEADLAECRKQTGDLQSELEELDSKLSVGMVYADYSPQVGNARVAYDRVPIGRLAPDCLSDVALHLEDAMNSYAKADSVWNHCLTDINCDNASIKPELQAKWSAATNSIATAKSGLADLGKVSSSTTASGTTDASTLETADSDSECVNASSGEPMECGDPGAVDREVYEESPASDGGGQ